MKHMILHQFSHILFTLAPDGTKKCPKLGGIHTPLARTPEELRLLEVMPSVWCSPERICVTNTQVLTLFYRN